MPTITALRNMCSATAFGAKKSTGSAPHRTPLTAAPVTCSRVQRPGGQASGRRRCAAQAASRRPAASTEAASQSRIGIVQPRTAASRNPFTTTVAWLTGRRRYCSAAHTSRILSGVPSGSVTVRGRGDSGRPIGDACAFRRPGDHGWAAPSTVRARRPGRHVRFQVGTRVHVGAVRRRRTRTADPPWRDHRRCPAIRGCSPGSPGSGGGGSAAGSSTRNVAPPPREAWARILPPWARTSSSVLCSPRPRPSVPAEARPR